MKKKLLLSLALIAATAGIARADVVNLAMGDHWGDADCNLTEWTQDGFVFTPDKGNNAKDKIPVYKQKNKEVRFYALNTLTISAPADGAPMTQLVFTLSKQGREEQAVITPSVGEMEMQTVGNSTVVWSGSAHSLTFTVGETNSLHTEGIADGSGQFDFVEIDIVTGESVIVKPEDSDTEFYMSNSTDDNGVLSEWTQGNLKFRADKGDDATANDPALKNGDEARFYAGNSLTISTVDGRDIESLEFILSEQGLQQQAAVTPSAGTVKQSQNANVVWTGRADTVTFTVGSNDYGTNPSKKGQFDFTQIRLKYSTQSGIGDTIGDDVESFMEYYNLQGVKVDNPSSGVFIRRQGTKVEKVIIK